MTCSVDTCEKTAQARGWCHAHYSRFIRSGDVRADVPVGRWTPSITDDLPNPWVQVAPVCPQCGSVAFLWAEGVLRWFCPPCRRRFDEAA